MNQIEWELQQRQTKIDKNLYTLQGKKDRGYISETAVGNTIISQFLLHIEEELIDLSMRKTRGMGGKYAQVLKDAAVFSDSYGTMEEDYRRVAYIGLITTLDNVFHQKNKKNYLSHIAQKIGESLENEQQLNYFRKDNEGLAYLHQLDVEGYKGQRKKRIQLIKKAFSKQEIEWQSWGSKVRVQIGLRVLKSIIRVMSDYLVLKTINTTGRKEVTVVPTNELYDFISEHTQYLIGKLRSTAPCIEPPIPWSSDDTGSITGGFHSLECSRTVPFVKHRTRQQRDYLRTHIPRLHIQCANSLQNVEWGINTPVLEFLKEVSLHNLFPDVIPTTQRKQFNTRPPDDHPLRRQWGQEAHQIVKWNKRNLAHLLRFQNVISLGNFFVNKPLWFVWNTDFRGRLYPCSSHLNPQGTDYVRGLLRFRKGKPLGKSGYKWLAVHGANCYGYNKVTYTDRYEWVMDNMDGILQIASKPDSSRGMQLLRESKSPFQFYAFCREWADLSKTRSPQAFVSHLPVTLDGSCNGFQHYSALLCDEDGASLVNLTHSELPTDLYGIITKELNTRIAGNPNHPLGTGGYTRELIKAVVMPVPHGITIRGISLNIQKELKTNDWDLIRYVAKEVIQIAEEFMPATKILRDWLKQISDLFAKADTPVHWISPVGFPVMQPYTLFKEESVKTDFFGSKTIYYRDKAQGVMRGKSSISLTPNFITSMDSSHLVLSVNKACVENINALTCIHDGIGTYAADTHRLREIVNESFCELYIPDVLEGIKKQWSDTINPPQQPEYGTYDITEVLTSPYFFH